MWTVKTLYTKHLGMVEKFNLVGCWMNEAFKNEWDNAELIHSLP